MDGTNETFEPGKRYPVTEVLSWWMTTIQLEPSWLPVMGPLHHDREFFAVDELHYHVDPRFLDDPQAAIALDEQERDHLNGRDGWHPAFRQLASWFPYTDKTGRTLAFKITDTLTTVTDRKLQPVRTEPPAWGIARIQTRSRNLVCRATLEPPRLDRSSANDGFRKLRRHYGRRCADSCPHRGYDLRKVPVDDTGHRQCPLHQLRVRAPSARKRTG